MKSPREGNWSCLKVIPGYVWKISRRAGDVASEKMPGGIGFIILQYLMVIYNETAISRHGFRLSSKRVDNSNMKHFF